MGSTGDLVGSRREISVYLVAIQLRFLGRPARDMVAILTERRLSKWRS